jgi:dTDP-4-amino-4,6-dideoxygalactose transaminase
MNRVHEALSGRGVATEIQYPVPIHEQPAFSGVGRVAGDLRITERLADRVLSLPMYPELEPEQLAYVASCLRESLPKPKVHLA